MAKLIDITGKAISGEWGNEDDAGIGIPVLRTTNFTNDGVVNYNTVVTRDIQKKDLSQKYLQPGDIIIEKSGGSDKQPVGRVVYYDGEPNTYLFNNFTGVLRVRDKSTWYPRYVFYALYGNYAKGGTRKYQNKTTGLHNLKTDQYVQDFSIQEQPIEYQREVVAKLDKVTELITLRKEQLAKLDQLIKSRFVEMFGDPKDNPNGFIQKRLKDTCVIVTGNTPSRAVDEYYGDFIEWIKTDNIVSGLLNPTVATEYLSKKGMVAGKTVEKNSILMACIAGSLSSIGRVCVTDRKVAFNQQINAIVPREYNAMFLYVMLLLSKDYLVEEINMALKGILSKSKLEEKVLVVPPIDLQNQFATFVDQTNKTKLTIQSSLDKLELLKKSLMQQYFG
ncbi:MAG: restriction endonuclease subunit S [Oscillospiraceae bacterium]|nr:restriction endonuclease subunit S [Oscillospiraceae bacterium]